MTISTTIIKNSYSGNGSTTAFTYGFKITAATEVQVIVKTNLTGAESIRAIGTGSTNYAVTGVGNNSGTVTFVTAPLSTETVVLRRSTTQTQAMDLIDNDPMSAETIETAHDKSIAITQELQEQIDRSLKISRANTMTSTEFITSATDRASKILAFDSSGELSVTQELGIVKGNWVTSTAYVVRDIVKDTNNNNIYICLTAHTSSGAVPISSNADVAKWSLLVDAATATTASTSAAADAATATTQAGIATAKAVLTASDAVDTAADAVATAADKVATNADAVSTAADVVSAAALLDTFDDKFLGSKSSDPSVDNDGATLTDGAIFYHTGDNRMKVYDLGTTTWFYVSPSSAEQTNINLVGTNIASVNTVATNVAGVNSFADRYRISSSAPASSLDVGDLYFDTSANELKVYKSSGWSAAGSTVNGTSARYNYTATAAQTTFTGSDTAGNTLAYDAGFADTYLNGIRLSAADVNITSGTSVVLAAGATVGDIIDIVGYGTFNVAAVAGSAINSGTINEARLPASALGAVWESKSANFVAEARKNYFCDTTGGAIDVTLPSGTIGDTVRFLDVSGTFDTNDLTVLNGSSKIQGASANLDVSTERAGFALVYYNSTQGWLLEDK
jgi:hypothetical protein